MADDLSNFDERAWRDAHCLFEVKFSSDSLKKIKALLDPQQVLRTGCRVLKHPDCCLICFLNNDCSRIPLHPNCRCRREGVLSSETIEGGITLGANANFGSTQGVRRGPTIQ